VGRGQFLEAVADNENAAVPFGRAGDRGERQGAEQCQREGRPHRASQPSHRPFCSALGRRRRLAPLLAAALALAFALPACGSESSAAPEPSTAPAPEPSSGETLPTEAPVAAATGCGPQLTGFLEALEHLRRNLAIGVSYEQYVAELGTVRRTYEQVPVAELDLACVSGPARSAERSFDGYLAAANTWGDCVSDPECATAELEPKLQHKWRAAAAQLAAAQRAVPSG
jgi:hypothetical protein